MAFDKPGPGVTLYSNRPLPQGLQLVFLWENKNRKQHSVLIELDIEEILFFDKVIFLFRATTSFVNNVPKVTKDCHIYY